MYQAFFGLEAEPFSISPDPRFLYMSERHREALAHLLYGVEGGGGFVLLTGEIGAGKTTLCRWFMEQVPERCQLAYVFNPVLTVLELLQTVCDEFHIEVKARNPDGSLTVKDHVDALNQFLLAAHAQDRVCLLIIDEAQHLSMQVLEQLRLLTNLETTQRKLLQIMLIGQPELRGILAQPQLEQLSQRVIARYHLEALSETETRSYLRQRLRVAGAHGPHLFSSSAVRRLHALAGGVPRRINLIADRALLGAFAKGKRVVNAVVVEQAAGEVLGQAPAVLQGKAVDGHATTPSSTRFVWAAGLGALGGGALIAALFWAWQAGRSSVVLPRPEALAVAAVAAVATSAKPVSAAPPEATSAPLALAASAPLRLASPASAPVLPSASLDATTAQRLAALPRNESTALAELASAWGVFASQEPACALALRAQVRCFRGKGQLAMLRRLGRPAVLTLVDGAGRPVYAPLMRLKGDTAQVQVGSELQSWPWPVLERLWRGDFTTLWRTPPGYQHGSTIAESDETGRWVAAQLAQLPGAEPAQPLRAQVLAFQASTGLPTSGRPGPMTLMQLNRIAGVSEPSLSPLP